MRKLSWRRTGIEPIRAAGELGREDELGLKPVPGQAAMSAEVAGS